MKFMKDESSFFIEIILQYNIITITYFMLHVLNDIKTFIMY